MKIINKIKDKKYIKLNREFIRDKGISHTAKILYGLLVSLAESCDSVFSSYKWLASEIGYEYKPKDTLGIDDEKRKQNEERAYRKYIAKYIAELEEKNLVRTVINIGNTNDYEIYEYNVSNPQVIHKQVYDDKEGEPKSSGYHEPKSSGGGEPKSSPSNKEYRNKESSNKKVVVEEILNHWFSLTGRKQETVSPHLDYWLNKGYTIEEIKSAMTNMYHKWQERGIKMELVYLFRKQNSNKEDIDRISMYKEQTKESKRYRINKFIRDGEDIQQRIDELQKLANESENDYILTLPDRTEIIITKYV